MMRQLAGALVLGASCLASGAQSEEPASERHLANIRQLTNGGENAEAYFSPDGSRLIIFSTNVHDPKGRDVDLYIVNVDGTGLERVTWNPTFDGFPMFSPDGKKLVFASNRNAAKPGDTNVFIADWLE